MTELSPQAQAVKDAVIALYTDQQQIRDWGWRLDAPTVAAALRAAATQIEPTQEDRAEEPEIHSQVFFNGVAWSAVQLLAIAAELEGGNG
jgi:hypothetical protein